MIFIVDYGLGNLGSIVNMFKRIGHPATIINDPAQLLNPSHIVLPGVGAFDTGMNHLREGAWIEPLKQKVLVERIPTLGICLGMQLMTAGSEEGELPGLGWIDGCTRKFPSGTLKVPHMGWNKVTITKESSVLPIDDFERRFYFVHSYFVELRNRNEILIEATYGATFTAGYEVNNIVGVQFHPEKSHSFGMELFRNFAANFPLKLHAQNESDTLPVTSGRGLS